MEDTSMKTHKLLTPQEVRDEFTRRGISVSTWAKKHGFNRNLANAVVRGDCKCLYGETHKIAVMLGMKHGEIVEEESTTS
jgi:gp16 family phage-associated protein